MAVVLTLARTEDKSVTQEVPHTGRRKAPVPEAYAPQPVCAGRSNGGPDPCRETWCTLTRDSFTDAVLRGRRSRPRGAAFWEEQGAPDSIAEA